MKTRRQIAQMIVEKRERDLRSIASMIVANRKPKNEIAVYPTVQVDVPEQHTEINPEINLPPMVVNIPQHQVEVSNIIEDQREVQPVNVDVNVVLPPESVKVEVNPVINVPEQPAPKVEVNVPKQEPAKVEVNIPETKKEPKEKQPEKAVIKHSDGTTSTVKLLKE